MQKVQSLINLISYSGFENNEIFWIEIYQNNKRINLVSFPAFLERDDPDIQINGITPEYFSPGEHYYLVVSENGAPTGNSISL